MPVLPIKAEGRGVEKEILESLSEWTVDTLPDLTILLDGPVSLGLDRIDTRSTRDRIEIEKRDFFERARQAYLDRAAEDPTRFVIVDATQPKMQMQSEVLGIIEARLHA